MRASPSGPGDHKGRLDPALLEACGHAADFLDRPSHQRCSLPSSLLFWGEVRLLARSRTTAIMANASITNETCRCQPCHERVSLWVSPNSVLAVSNASSMAQRRPSTRTSVSIGVPAGDQVEKKAQSYKRAPLVPSPADRRCQVSGARALAICSAVPATSGLSIQDEN